MNEEEVAEILTVLAKGERLHIKTNFFILAGYQPVCRLKEDAARHNGF